jgi:branched-chain amino acid transport system ATP-binding protein
MALLEVKGLKAYYGQIEALRGIDFDLNDREIVTILGANGAGKTTSLRAVCGMVRTEGSIMLEGDSVQGMSTENIVSRHRIAHVPEGRGTFTRVTTEENLRLGAYSRRDKEIEQDYERVYHYFPRLKERREQQSGTLSGGEQQMLAVGRAMMLRPKVMLLDEPSFGLAPLITEELFEILATINREEGVAMLIVEQNANLALNIASRAYLLETGNVAMTGPADQIMNDEQVRKSYLGY